MKYEDMLERLAPCGLNCGKCMAYAKGEIRFHGEKLKELLGSFDGYAERFKRFWPVFEHYPSFKAVLDHFTNAGCRGCRAGDCAYPNCGVAACYKGKGVDFCFQCGEFPCAKTNFDDNLKTRWLSMNTRMKEIGVERYFEESKDAPRYV